MLVSCLEVSAKDSITLYYLDANLPTQFIETDEEKEFILGDKKEYEFLERDIEKV